MEGNGGGELVPLEAALSDGVTLSFSAKLEAAPEEEAAAEEEAPTGPPAEAPKPEGEAEEGEYHHVTTGWS